MRSVVSLGGDTDTNGCILGALLGARFGEATLMAESCTRRNIEMVLNCKPSVRRRTRDGPERRLQLPKEYSAMSTMKTLEEELIYTPAAQRAKKMQPETERAIQA